MWDLGKGNVLGILVDAVDYDAAVHKVVQAARDGRGFATTALAVHGIMTGVQDEEHRYRLNQFDLVTPDGQPVRWALNMLHGTRLSKRVYGPTLTLAICAAAETHGLPIYLYGSKPEVLERLSANLRARFPKLVIAGAEPSKFRRTSQAEKAEIAQRIRASGAKITFVGLGCPRQEIFAYEYRDLLGMPVVAVGAAFDYHAGLLDEPPGWVQEHGLQWLYRLVQEPRRLWRRYLLLNPAFLTLLALQALRLWHPRPAAAHEPTYEVRYG